METNNSKFLPLGSVVLLKKAKKRIMITGYAIRTAEKKDKVWDYLGCLYPEGTISPDKNLVFDHDDIETIYATGYCDDEHKRFINYMIQTLGEKKDDLE